MCAIPSCLVLTFVPPWVKVRTDLTTEVAYQTGHGEEQGQGWPGFPSCEATWAVKGRLG